MTSKPAPSKRVVSSSSIPAAKPACKIHATAVVADKAQLTGGNLIEIGENTIIHPHAKIKADHGNIIIGKNCIISEKAIIGVTEAGSSDGSETDVVIGDGVSIESGVTIEARKIGEYTTIEVNARVGRGAILGKWCKVAPLEAVKEGEVLEDFMVVFADGKRRVDGVCRERREMREVRIRGREKEIELLRTLIPDGKAKWMG